MDPTIAVPLGIFFVLIILVIIRDLLSKKSRLRSFLEWAIDEIQELLRWV